MQPVNAQVPEAVSQTPVPSLNTVVQFVRAAPQVVLVFASQPPLNEWNPVLQVTVQVPAATSHVATAFAMAVQSTGGEPHAVFVFGAHAFDTGWKPVLHDETVHAPFGVAAAVVHAPEPLANRFVQSVQPGPGPQQVALLTSQAVELEFPWKPCAQPATPHTPPARQVMVPCGSWCAASVQSTPAQLVTASDTQMPPSWWKPASQAVSTHAPAVHVPVPLGNAFVQSSGGEPHASLVSGAHAPASSWKPALQAMPQLAPSHVAEPFAGAAQGVHEAPQLCTLVSCAQAPPHRCAPLSHEVSTHVPLAELHAPVPPGNAVVQSAASGPQARSVSAAQSVPLTCCPAGQAQRPLTQTVDAQSIPLTHFCVAAHGAQLPPQSTSLSLPFCA